MTVDDLHNPVGREEIKIVPVVAGAGGNFAQIFAGIALVGFAIATAGAGTGFFRFRGWIDWNGFSNNWQFSFRGFVLGAAAFTAIGSIGLGLVLTGVAGMISPTPQIPQGPDTEQDPRKSFSFSGIQNTSRGERQCQSFTAKR